MEPMDDILSDKPKEEAVEEAPQVENQPVSSVRREHQKQEYAAQGRDPETGKFVPKEDPKEEPKVEAKVEPKVEAKEPVKQELSSEAKAFLAEADRQRRRAQELEKRIAIMEANQKPKEPEKPFWDDPEGTLKRQQEELSKAKEEMRQIQFQTKMQTAEVIARSKYSDFDEKVAKFGEIIQATPGLAQQWLASPDPAEFAYKAAKSRMEIDEAGSMEEWKRKIETEVRAKLEAELKAKAEELEKKRRELPPSLSNARGTTVNRQVWNGPTSMGDILK